LQPKTKEKNMKKMITANHKRLQNYKYMITVVLDNSKAYIAVYAHSIDEAQYCADHYNTFKGVRAEVALNPLYSHHKEGVINAKTS